MTDKEGEALEGGAQETIAVEEGAEPSPDQAKLEAEAREMGWKPKEAWKGDPETWRPANEFVKRGKEILPIVNAELRKVKAENAELKRTHADEIAGVTKMSQKALKMLREQIEARYEPLKDRAISEGDNKTFRAVEKAQKDAVQKFDTEVEATTKPDPKDKPKGEQLTDREQTVMASWLDENRSWFDTDEDLRFAANRLYDKVSKEKPGADLRERLDEVKERLEEKFPLQFGKQSNGRGNGAAKVEGANGRGPEGGDSAGGDLWRKVPEEVRKTAAKTLIEEERIFDHLVGAKKGQPLTQAQLRAAREKYAEQYLQN